MITMASVFCGQGGEAPADVDIWIVPSKLSASHLGEGAVGSVFLQQQLE